MELGRISGQLLKNNLERNGFDLSFRNEFSDPAVLYLDVNNKRLGINQDLAVVDLDVNGTIISTNFISVNEAEIDFVKINPAVEPDVSFTTVTGALIVEPNQSADPVINHQRVETQHLIFADNYISSKNNQNIRFDPNGTGTIELEATTNVTGDLSVSNNIETNGNLLLKGKITIGDNSSIDTVTIRPSFDQTIEPGLDNEWELGSSSFRWKNLHAVDLSTTDNLVTPLITVSDQLQINGTTRTITAVQSNDDVRLISDTGIYDIEQTRWQNSDITNLSNNPLIFTNTGTGYVRFTGTGAIAVPIGTTAERPLNPEIGATRWNTTRGLLEVYDPNTPGPEQWTVATGGGETVTQVLMEDLSNEWILILG